MMIREVSLHNRGATTIRTDYNPAGNSRPHDICRSPTYIYQPTLGSSKTRTGPRHPRTQHTSNPATFKPQGYPLLPPSHHSQCVSIHLSIGLAKVGLPEYVTSTTKCLVQKIHNEWPLSDIVGNITKIQDKSPD